MKDCYVYILASKKNGVMYIGVTDKLKRRIFEHRNGLIKGFTSKFYVKQLVYYESTNDVTSAILREKQMKRWKREWKVELIEKQNPDWKDLFEQIL